jgi:D-alanyl-D-alanine carboxypeptidase
MNDEEGTTLKDDSGGDRRRVRQSLAGAVTAALLATAALAATGAMARGTPSPQDLGSAVDEVVGSRLQQELDSYVAMNSEVPGVVVSIAGRDGEVRWTGASGQFDSATGEDLRSDDSFRAASVTKTFTAATVLRLAEKRELALDDKVGELLPRNIVDRIHVIDGINRGGEITIEQLLSHSSGIWDYATSEKFTSAVRSDPTRRWTPDELLDFAATNGSPYSPPGQEFHYSDTGYVLLGLVIEKVAERPLATAYRDLLRFDDLGLDATYLEGREEQPAGATRRAHQYSGDTDVRDFDPSFDNFGGGGIVTNSRDLSRFFSALFAGQVYDNASTLQSMLARSRAFDVTSYAKGIYKAQVDGNDRWGHSGYFGSFAHHFPEQGVTVAGSVNTATPLLLENATDEYASLERRLLSILAERAAPLPSSLERLACPAVFSPEQRASVRCVAMVAPMDRREPGGPVVRMPVAIHVPEGGVKKFDPFLFLPGANGASFTEGVGSIFDLHPAIAPGRLFITMDHRGSGLAEPGTSCSSLNYGELVAGSTAETLQKCGDEIRAKQLDPNDFTAVSGATDAAELRALMGFTDWNVYGISYGTLWALNLVRDHPEGIRSVTLDGVRPPDFNIFSKQYEQQPIADVLAACAAQESCRQAYPQLAEEVSRAASELENRPHRLPDGSDLTSTVFFRLLSAGVNGPTVADIPRAVRAAAQGDYDRAAKILTSAEVAEAEATGADGPASPVPPPDSDNSLNWPLNICRTYAIDRGNVAPPPTTLLPPSLDRAWQPVLGPVTDGCAALGVAPGPSTEREAVRSAVPTLILNGQWDAATIPAEGRMAAQTLPRGQIVDLPGLNHFTLVQQPVCVGSIIGGFLDDPAGPVDRSCAQGLPATVFALPDKG